MAGRVRKEKQASTQWSKARLEEFRKRKEEEDEAMCLIEEMRKNLEAPQHKSCEAEQRLCNALQVYVDPFDKDRRTIMAKLWQLMPSRDTKNLNLDKDLKEILSKMKQMGRSEEVKTRRPWPQDEDDDQ